ncbi:O-antigen polymerase [Mycolicibacterium monacense]|uniref:O-antigen polymerase n=1 Tax=Mycolicibacterium monacense TaxID=85693 RepID=UPI0007EC1B43|nr:O-antigen polymerase [Mycolicibacterium monacense]OBF47125.1 hypothetical protein A5778_26005 [Mycolicibacterium monacense]
MTDRRVTPRLWWLSPTAVTVTVAAIAIALTATVGDERFRALWNTPKSITDSMLVVMFCGALAMALGALVVGALRPTRVTAGPWPDLPEAAVSGLRRISTVLVTLTLVGYAGFGFLTVRAGIGWADLAGAAGYDGATPVKDAVGTIPGVTTMTQFGIASVIVSTLVLTQRFDRVELVKLLLVVGAALPRAYIFTERLAILELVVPIAVLVCFRAAQSPRWARLLQFLPVLAIPAVVLFFSVFEYFRSWEFFRTTGESFWQFSTERVAGYYATALNNGYLEYTHLNVPTRRPLTTLQFLWDAPGVRGLGLYDQLAGRFPGRNGPVQDADYGFVLEHFGNLEFNNSSGYAVPLLDYGYTGGLIYFLIVGVVAGLLYRAFREGHSAGLLLYPVLFVGLLELPRYMHWTQGRAFPAIVVLIGVAVWLNRCTRRARLADSRRLPPVRVEAAAASTL